MSASRLVLIVSAICFFAAAALLVLKTAGDLVEPLALAGLGFWALSGAI